METLYNAKQDFLTNCYTRDSINPYLDKLIAEHKAYDREFSIILLDVDHFKPFNDKYGHLYGDEVLKYFSSSIRLGLANIESIVFRFGGDEFIVVLPEKNEKEAYKIAIELQNTLRGRPFLLGGKLLKMSFSGGVVSCATGGDSPDSLVASADKAMYVSKKHGRARTTAYSRIWSDRLRVLGMALIVLLAIGAVASLSAFFSKGPFSKSSRSFPPIKFSNPFRAAGAAINAQKAVTIRLKSGYVIRGRVVKEGPNDIEVSLSLDKGEGSLTIKKSNIKSIERE
jgi:diguanylate cyclase (GGDEF)-like protein